MLLEVCDIAQTTNVDICIRILIMLLAETIDYIDKNRIFGLRVNETFLNVFW